MEKLLARWYPRILFSAAVVGLVASFWQAVERVHMLQHPTMPLSCNLNPVLSCGDVLSNRWSSLFGFPNAFIGIVIFALLALYGYLLLACVPLNRAANGLLLALNIILMGFAVWFFGMSLYVIGAVCLFCIFTWAVAMPLFWYGLLWSIEQKVIRGHAAQRLLVYGKRHHLEVLIVLYIVLLGLFFYRFRSYYFA